MEGGAVIAKEGNAANFQAEGTIINIDAILNAKLGFVRNESAWVITRQYLLDNGVSAEQIAAIEDEANGNILYYADATAVAQAVQKGEVDVAFTPLEYALLYADAYGLEIVTPAGALQENYVCCREVTSRTRPKTMALRYLVVNFSGITSSLSITQKLALPLARTAFSL